MKSSINQVKGLLKPVYQRFPLSQLPDAVKKLQTGNVAGRCVVDFNA
jgi:propanol-preferring alcohol dehydrogenase